VDPCHACPGRSPAHRLVAGTSRRFEPAGQKGEQEHTDDQAVLVALSGVGQQVMAKRSGHHIPLDEPDLVVAAIRDIIAAAPR